jgi:hypothetical protein
MRRKSGNSAAMMVLREEGMCSPILDELWEMVQEKATRWRM